MVSGISVLEDFSICILFAPYLKTLKYVSIFPHKTTVDIRNGSFIYKNRTIVILSMTHSQIK